MILNSQFLLVRERLNLLYIVIGSLLLQFFEFFILQLYFGILVIFADEKRTFLKCRNIWVIDQISVADKRVVRKVYLLRCNFSADRACRLLIDREKFDQAQLICFLSGNILTGPSNWDSLVQNTLAKCRRGFLFNERDLLLLFLELHFKGCWTLLIVRRCVPMLQLWGLAAREIVWVRGEFAPICRIRDSIYLGCNSALRWALLESTS